MLLHFAGRTGKRNGIAAVMANELLPPFMVGQAMGNADSWMVSWQSRQHTGA